MRTRYALDDSVALDDRVGSIVDGQAASGGEFSFTVAEGMIEGTVLKATSPDVALTGAQVWLVQEVEGGHPVQRYAVLVDDAYWGVRMQPARFTAAPFTEKLVMGYRLQGKVMDGETPVAGANVSLELTVNSVEDGELILWDSEEYNELVYSEELETWIEGPTVLCPLMTDEEGRWSAIVPKGHGAMYQRASDKRDGSSGTGDLPLSRWVERVRAMHRGRWVEVGEGLEPVIDVAGGALEITGTPDAWVQVGALDDVGQAYNIPSGGVVQLTGLPSGEHSIVQYKRTGWGDWDSAWGCARCLAEVVSGETVAITMAQMEEYDPDSDVMAGRVYLRAGVPAGGLDIQIVDLETCEIVGVAATTGNDGFWTVQIPPNGFGGELCIHDPTWGSVPIFGFPYSDVVLGARIYSSWFDEFRPEAWRKGNLGHKNFSYVQGAVWVEDAQTRERFDTTETGYGGWVTAEALPKHRFIEDLSEFVNQGSQLRMYDLMERTGPLAEGLALGSQSFTNWETPMGFFRASGWYPETKLLLGGKVHGNVVAHAEGRIDEGEPEAARVGLEFGDLVAHAEVRTGPNDDLCTHSAVADLLCPYCGGPAWRDPGPGPAARGCCIQCAVAFGSETATDCRTYFRSPTLGNDRDLKGRCRFPVMDFALVREFAYHWRPDLYDEAEGFLSQAGTGLGTNAPRWVAQHVNELGDGRGLGQFDGDVSPMFIEGHDLDHFGALLDPPRELGLGQLKLCFSADYSVPLTFRVALDCVLANGEIEERVVEVAAGLRGPCEEKPFGDVVRVCDAPKMKAELLDSPYRAVGLYKGVSHIRLVSPSSAAGCQFTVVADNPLLASAEGVPVAPRRSCPVALQVDRVWGRPTLECDSVGQVLLAYVDEGDVRVHRRGGLETAWDQGSQVTDDQVSDYPSIAKDRRGTLGVIRQHGQGQSLACTSRNDGRSLEG